MNFVLKRTYPVTDDTDQKVPWDIKGLEVWICSAGSVEMKRHSDESAGILRADVFIRTEASVWSVRVGWFTEHQRQIQNQVHDSSRDTFWHTEKERWKRETPGSVLPVLAFFTGRLERITVFFNLFLTSGKEKDTGGSPASCTDSLRTVFVQKKPKAYWNRKTQAWKRS
jgi:hypothetical protein